MILKRKIMKKVILLLRVSTTGQDYEYQRNTLTDLCRKNGWAIVHTVENKVSGAKRNEDRAEIIELLDYVDNNHVDSVVCLAIDRLGRNTIEALKVVETLNEKRVNIHFANYGIDTLLPNGEVNPVAKLILTICLEISSWERTQIRYRMKVGYDNYLKQCREQGIKMGRPETYRKSDEKYREQYIKELSLLRKGISLRNVCKITGTSVNTLRKIKHLL
jgi:DNA invertase Pin-like site-specific DNA recombinase